MAVRMALRPIPRLAQQPVVSPSENARAVAMPWLTTPRAKPLPEGEVTRVSVRIYGPTTAPMMPVKIVRHAATAGMPPMPLAISIDTAAVADGARDSNVDGEPPAHRKTSLADRSSAIRTQGRGQDPNQVEPLQIAMQTDRQSDDRRSGSQ